MPGPLVFGVGTYFEVPTEYRSETETVRATVNELQARFLGLGGRPYLHGWFEFDAQQKEQLYGPALRRLQTLRRSLDPDDLLNTGIWFTR